MRVARSIARKGFTLVELLVVITIILLISSLFLGLSAGDGGGLPAGQRVLASSIRTVRAMALMNRGPGEGGVNYGGRYRLLILNDPDDEVNHLRQFVIAVGGVSAEDLAGADPTSVTNTSASPYLWFRPSRPSRCPVASSSCRRRETRARPFPWPTAWCLTVPSSEKSPMTSPVPRTTPRPARRLG